MPSLFMTLIVAIVLMIFCWLASLRLNDVSIVDILWAPAFAIVAWACAATAPHHAIRRWIVLALISIWAIRLGSHLYRRWHGLGHEDYRYAKIRRERGPNFPVTSLFWIFVPQAILVWIVSLPLQAAVNSTIGLGWLDILGTVVGATGMAIEAVADAQLRRFRSLPENKENVMRTGLWAWSRHPNYFGDFILWWGIFLLALAGGAPWWTVLGPLVMSVLLIRVSGVGLLEQTIADRRPAYRQYIRDTSSFILWPPGGRNRAIEAE